MDVVQMFQNVKAKNAIKGIVRKRDPFLLQIHLLVGMPSQTNAPVFMAFRKILFEVTQVGAGVQDASFKDRLVLQANVFGFGLPIRVAVGGMKLRRHSSLTTSPIYRCVAGLYSFYDTALDDHMRNAI
jgi:hypothetical protein